MKYNHKVKFNGKIYPAGTDVPVKGKQAADKPDAKNVERMVARIKELDNTVMQRNEEIQSLQVKNEELKNRIVELEAAIPPEDDSDENPASGKSDAKTEEKQSKQKKSEK